MITIQVGYLTRFSKYVSHDGAQLNLLDETRLIFDEEETNFESKDEKQNQSLQSDQNIMAPQLSGIPMN